MSIIQKGDIQIQLANTIVMVVICADLAVLVILFVLFGPIGLLGLIGNFESISPLPEILIILLISSLAFKIFLFTDDRQVLILKNNKVLIKSRIFFFSRNLRLEEIVTLKKIPETGKYCIETINEFFIVVIPLNYLDMLKLKTLPNTRL